jgi:hypothetical protein
MVRVYAPVRRVVTGVNERGLSCVLFDSEAPNVHPRPSSPGVFFTELWTINQSPENIRKSIDTSPAGKEFQHSPPSDGAHWRLGHTSAVQKNLSQKDARLSHNSMNKSGVSELKSGGRHWNLHRTPTIDYAWCLKGQRDLVLDEIDVRISKGDIVVQLANFHAWENRSNVNVDMSYVMIGADLKSVFFNKKI